MQMSEANKASMLRFFEEVFNQGKLEVIDEISTQDFVSHDLGNPLHNREGIKVQVETIRAAFPDVRFTADDMIAEGEKVAVRFTMRGTQRGDFMGIPPTDKHVTVTGVDIVRFSEGKAVEHWHEWSGLLLMQQLGVLPALSVGTG
jgi:predicted ester cyclase